LAAIGVTINNEDLIQIILNVIINNYDAFIQSVYARQEYPTFDQLVGQLIHEKNQQLLCHGQKHEKVLFIRTKRIVKSNDGINTYNI
jgi:hypothetical protein